MSSLAFMSPKLSLFSDKILPDKIQQLKDVQDSIEKWEGKHIMESSSELIQGKLMLLGQQFILNLD